jgi:hypothetical protein
LEGLGDRTTPAGEPSIKQSQEIESPLKILIRKDVGGFQRAAPGGHFWPEFKFEA